MLAGLVGLALAAAFASSSPNTPPPPTDIPAGPVVTPATIPLSVQFDLTSKITGRTYRLYVSRPPEHTPAAGLPVLYVLDGDAAFPTAASQALLRTLGGAHAGLVVGIGYPNFLATTSLRNRDLTPSPPDARSLAEAPGSKPEDFGGADGFHQFMMTELRPLIAAKYPVDPAKQSLMGYSLGGLFALHVLFNHPEAYATYVVGSPSIWWNKKEVLSQYPAFVAGLNSTHRKPRVLITSDQWEQDPPEFLLPKTPKERAQAIEESGMARMADNARSLAAQLKAPPASLEVHYVLFSEETHLTGIPASTSRGVAFAFSQ